MPSFYNWLLRLLLLVALCVLSIILFALWPDGHAFRWIDFAGVFPMGLATLGVAVWTVTAWLGNIAPEETTVAAERARAAEGQMGSRRLFSISPAKASME